MSNYLVKNISREQNKVARNPLDAYARGRLHAFQQMLDYAEGRIFEARKCEEQHVISELLPINCRCTAIIGENHSEVCDAAK